MDLEKKFLLLRKSYKHVFSEFFDVRFTILAQVFCEISQFLQKMGSVIVKTPCSTVKRQYFNFFSHLVSIIHAQVLEKLQKISRTSPSLDQPHEYI